MEQSKMKQHILIAAMAIVCVTAALAGRRDRLTGEKSISDDPAKPEAAVREPWDVIYRGTELPAAPWRRYRVDCPMWQPGSNTVAEVRDGKLLLADRGSEAGDHIYYNCYWGMAPDDEIVLEVRMRLVSGWSEIGFSNGRYLESLRFTTNKVYTTQSGLSCEMDTTSDFHEYRIVVLGQKLQVYVDGNLKLDGKMTCEVLDQQTQVRFGGADNPGKCEAYWEYVRFRRDRRPAGGAPAAIRKIDLNGPLFKVVDRHVYNQGTEGQRAVKALFEAMYPEVKGRRLIGNGLVSEDNGRTWESWSSQPDFKAGLPKGYRREAFPPVLDQHTGRLIQLVNAMDTPGLDPKIIEPPIGANTYYLRYRVSEDGGRTWLFEKPVVQDGRIPEQPFEGIRIGKNGFYFGDMSIPAALVARDGAIFLFPSCTVLGENGTLVDPTGWGYYEIIVIRGEWTKDAQIRWTGSARVRVAADRSTRGVCEATLAEFDGVRMLLVMRGSNAGRKNLPARRWAAVSSDGGRSWSEAQPWTYDDGEPFYSCAGPSAFIRHSSGRVFWVGNISEKNGYGNDQRWPLVIGEVDPANLTLRRQSVQILDTRMPEDERLGRLVLNHGWRYEDRETGEIVLYAPRLRGPEQGNWQTVVMRLRLLSPTQKRGP
jgi:hypothetical protein